MKNLISDNKLFAFFNLSLLIIVLCSATSCTQDMNNKQLNNASVKTAAAGKDNSSQRVTKDSKPKHEYYTSQMPEFLASPAEGFTKKMKVLILAYLPTEDNINLNSDLTGINMSLEAMKNKIDRMSVQAKFMLEEGSKYHGYSNSQSKAYMGYEIVDYIFVYDKLPTGLQIGSDGSMPVYRPHYADIVETWNGKHYINDSGVDEIWLWGWHHGNIVPAESNMSSNHINTYSDNGDISNSEHTDDLPKYNNTYVVYNYNYGRSANEAVHNHLHQYENMMWHISKIITGSEAFIREKFSGWQHWDDLEKRTAPLGAVGDCHHPVNTDKDYDYRNETLVYSDIEDWNPERTGEKKQINCNTWYQYFYNKWPEGYDITEPVIGGSLSSASTKAAKTEAAWYIYWMQNIPGYNNNISYLDQKLTNWQDFKADWDNTMNNNTKLYK